MVRKLFIFVSFFVISIACAVFYNVPAVLARYEFTLIPWLKENSRIIFIHVPTTWPSAAAFFISAIYSAKYISEKNADDDAKSNTIFRVLLIFCVLLTINGALWARIVWGSFNVNYVFLVLTAAAVLGDTVSYVIGHLIGPKIFHKENMRFLKKEYLERTHKFYKKYGGKTIIVARFRPIFRNLAPFVAGIGSMKYSKFIVYTIAGAALWVAMFVYAGSYIGNIDFIKRNFSIVLIALILISFLPGIKEHLKHR